MMKHLITLPQLSTEMTYQDLIEELQAYSPEIDEFFLDNPVLWESWEE